MKILFAGLLAVLFSGCLDDKEIDEATFRPTPPVKVVDASLEPVPDAGPLDPETWRLKVATWNVRRFFDTQCDSGSCGSGDFEEAPSATAFTQRARQIADSIEALDADVVLLQEVENVAALDGVLTLLGPEWGVAELGEVGFAGSMDVVALAKGHLMQRVDHRRSRIRLPESGGTTTFAREFLEVRLRVRGASVIVFSAHFKSKANDEPERRLAEAIAAAAIVGQVAAQNPDSVVVLGGDLNDTPGSPAIEALENDRRLSRVAADMPSADAWTHRYGGQGNFIDHLFLGGIGGEYVPGSARIFRADSGYGYGGSDHAALTAEFRLAQ